MAQAKVLPVTKQTEITKANRGEAAKISPPERSAHTSLIVLQNHLGNRAVQRLLAQCSGDGSTELDNETANRINRQRGGGMTLDTAIQKKMSEAMGHDFRDVRVHTSREGHELSQQLNAKAFTTGRDIFFREGEYSPQSSNGQELLAHELTHVVQQNLGSIENEGSMIVNAPNDEFEIEADRVAKTLSRSPNNFSEAIPKESNTEIQRQEDEESYYEKAKSALGKVDTIFDSTQFAGDIAQEMHFAKSLVDPALDNLDNIDFNLAVQSFLPDYGIRHLSDSATNLGSKAGNYLNVAGNITSGIGIASSGVDLYEATTNRDVGGQIQAGADMAADAVGALGPVGNAFSAGYGIGQIIDKDIVGGLTGKNLSDHTAEGMQQADQGVVSMLREGGILDKSKPAYTQTLGWQIAEGMDTIGQTEDKVLSGASNLMSDSMLSVDQAATSGMRALGLYDEKKPAYTQTLGWKLGEWLGI